MKKIIGLLTSLCFCSWLLAQSVNVESASVSLKRGELKDAKDYIDQALTNEKTANDPKMWYYRGKVYMSIDTTKGQFPIDEECVQKGIEACIKCIETDTRDKYKRECEGNLVNLGFSAFNRGVNYYQNKNYDLAITLFDLIEKIVPLDTEANLKRNNVSIQKAQFYAYYAARDKDDYELGKKYLQKLIDSRFNKPQIYKDMCEILLKKDKDTAKALEYLDKGREMFEEDRSLIEYETNVYLAMGKGDILVQKLTKAIEVDQYNYKLYYIRARFYEQEGRIAEAEADFAKSIELEPSYFDALYSFGVLYFNKAADITKVANDLPPSENDKYEKLKAESVEYFKKAQPHLEAALGVEPENVKLMVHVLKLYGKTNQSDKYKALKAKFDELQNKK